MALRSLHQTAALRGHHHRERHKTRHIGWLRAAVLGANDGILSTASLVIGVAAANAARGDILVAGVAGLVAGAMSMAAGEYVSVSSQADTEQADLTRVRKELAENVGRDRQDLRHHRLARYDNPALPQRDERDGHGDQAHDAQ